jgi:hypothetical protein
MTALGSILLARPKKWRHMRRLVEFGFMRYWINSLQEDMVDVVILDQYVETVLADVSQLCKYNMSEQCYMKILKRMYGRSNVFFVCLNTPLSTCVQRVLMEPGDRRFAVGVRRELVAKALERRQEEFDLIRSLLARQWPDRIVVLNGEVSPALNADRVCLFISRVLNGNSEEGLTPKRQERRVGHAR